MTQSGTHPFILPLLKSRQAGSTLVVTVVLITVLLVFAGITLYLGIQTYLQSELQKAANSAVLIGASEMYTSTGTALPQRNSATAVNAANAVLNTIRASSDTINTFYLTHTVTAGNNDTLTMNINGKIPTPFLSIVGLNDIQVSAQSTARAVLYQLKPPTIAPSSTNPAASMYLSSANFPILDHNGNDILLRQSIKEGYYVELCNAASCYNIGFKAKPIDGGSVKPDGLVTGSALIDLHDVNVAKGSAIKITHSGSFTRQINGQTQFYLNRAASLRVDSISMYGYASLCPDQYRCPVPEGFVQY